MYTVVRLRGYEAWCVSTSLTPQTPRYLRQQPMSEPLVAGRRPCRMHAVTCAGDFVAASMYKSNYGWHVSVNSSSCVAFGRLLRLTQDLAGYGVTDIAAVESSQNVKRASNIRKGRELSGYAHDLPTPQQQPHILQQTCLTFLLSPLIPLTGATWASRFVKMQMYPLCHKRKRPETGT
ncbi:hypothetical protein BU25DRAFT_250474 [Macroventuria anomochaeta]|uniref:Uncharacterized protein n=1 Tax=Macroventuria anomochaeta TaxID=301207 RepID=A0ACB6SBB5_9PLEO|nr:uncharacterized protein BU25DRAFT_250474 [Macroventuria anomochaeta]KAF2630880.1 hypothetical protein BU25DRAFT_250474 [Macroventuria anomochaeta]